MELEVLLVFMSIIGMLVLGGIVYLLKKSKLEEWVNININWIKGYIWEGIFFILIATVVVLVIMFYYHSRINKHIINSSACYTEMRTSQEPAIYQVTARYMKTPIFNVTYDTQEKTQKMRCACPSGDKKTTVHKIPYYDMNVTADGQQRVKYVDKLMCDCEQTMDIAADDPKISYYGEKGISNFMYDQQNTGFFDNIFIGYNSEYETSSVGAF